MVKPKSNIVNKIFKPNFGLRIDLLHDLLVRKADTVSYNISTK